MGWPLRPPTTAIQSGGRRRFLPRYGLLPAILAVLLVLAALLPRPAQAMRADRVTALRQETVKMFYHGFDNYMQIAFPEDEVRCKQSLL